MAERLTESQIQIAEDASREFESSRLILAYPHRYTEKEVRNAGNFLREQAKNFIIELLDNDEADPQLLLNIYLGIYHHNDQLQPLTKLIPLSAN